MFLAVERAALREGDTRVPTPPPHYHDEGTMTSGPWSTCPEGCVEGQQRAFHNHPGMETSPDCYDCFLVEGERMTWAMEEDFEEEARALPSPVSEGFFEGRLVEIKEEDEDVDKAEVLLSSISLFARKLRRRD